MKNLHVFNWRCQRCGVETYQGPTPTTCISCHRSGPFERVIYWDCQAGGTLGKPWDGGREVRSEFWMFDHTLHFQYWFGYKKRAAAQGELVDVMSSIGACFFMRRARFLEIGGLDEAAGSWGSYGTEIACKSWLSGGRHITNKRTFFAHLFRTSGGDFSFPYANPGSAIEKARQYTTRMWMENRWPQQVLPLSWLVEKFAPIPGWHEAAGRDALDAATRAGAAFSRVRQRLVAAPQVDRVSVQRDALHAASEGSLATGSVGGDGQPMSPGAHLLSRIDGSGGSRPGEIGPKKHEPQVSGVATARVVADHMIELRDVSAFASLERTHQPGVEQPMGQFVPGTVSDQAITRGQMCSGPEPASTGIDRDFGEDAAERSSVEVIDRETLCDSHDVTSSEGCGVVRADLVVEHRVGPLSVPRPLTRGLVYYTDNRLDDNPVGQAVRARLRTTGLPIVCVSLKPLAFGDRTIVLPGERGPLMMFRQILAGLEALDTDIAFLVEHDVLYSPEHFRFTPGDDQHFYYNQHRWQVSARDGRAVHYRASQTSGCCAYRSRLIDHYRKRVAHIEAHGWDRNIGYEPGTNARSRAFDPHGALAFWTETPNIDVRDVGNLSKSKWSLADFRNKANAVGWTEADTVPGWGTPKGQFPAWLQSVTIPSLTQENAR